MVKLQRIRNLLSSRKGLRDVLTLSGAQIALKPIQVVKSVVVAKYLGPEAFGILKSVELISMLNKFGSLGFKPAINRNVTTAKANDDFKEVKNIKNNAYSGELLLSLGLFLVGLLISFFFSDKVITTTIILASVGLFTAKLLGIFQTELQVNKKFSALGKIILYNGIINSVIIIATVPFFEIYAVLIVPSLSSLVVTYLAFQITGKFFHLKMDRKGMVKILKVSLPLTLATLSFGLFRYTERFLIIGYLGLTSVGIFGFADTIVGIFISILLGSVLKVRGIKIYEELGKGNFMLVHKMIVKETAILIGISLVFIVLIFIVMKFLIPVVLPEWINAINITIFFSFIIPIKLLSSYVSFVIKSPAVNKMQFAPKMQLSGLSVMLIGFFVLKTINRLDLTNFIMIDLLAYGVVHVGSVLYYYRVYYLKFIKRPLIE